MMNIAILSNGRYRVKKSENVCVAKSPEKSKIDNEFSDCSGIFRQIMPWRGEARRASKPAAGQQEEATAAAVRRRPFAARTHRPLLSARLFLTLRGGRVGPGQTQAGPDRAQPRSGRAGPGRVGDTAAGSGCAAPGRVGPGRTGPTTRLLCYLGFGQASRGRAGPGRAGPTRGPSASHHSSPQSLHRLHQAPLPNISSTLAVVGRQIGLPLKIASSESPPRRTDICSHHKKSAKSAMIHNTPLAPSTLISIEATMLISLLGRRDSLQLKDFRFKLWAMRFP